jgi:hypothetical protein
MTAEPEKSGEPVPDRAARPQGPALVLASAEPPADAAAAEPRPESPAHQEPDPPPEAGSLHDLRHRLERLPHGHPSSPYHDDGERKPHPPRLKHLELAPPSRATPARGSVAAAAESAPAQPPTTVPTPASESTATAAPLLAQERTAPPTAAPPPPAPGTAPPLSAPPATPPPPAPGTAPPLAAPRTAPDGSWSWGQVRLGSDLVRVAQDAYDRFRAAEGRDLFGQYGKGGLTPMLHRVAKRIARGRLADDTDEHALLERDVFLARFADLRARHPDRSPEQLARRVPGALSYCFLIDAGHYSDGILLVQEALELQGFQLQARRNAWSSHANRCVQTIWRDPLTDLPFEVQFQAANGG